MARQLAFKVTASNFHFFLLITQRSFADWNCIRVHRHTLLNLQRVSSTATVHKVSLMCEISLSKGKDWPRGALDQNIPDVSI